MIELERANVYDLGNVIVILVDGNVHCYAHAEHVGNESMRLGDFYASSLPESVVEIADRNATFCQIFQPVAFGW